MTNRARRLGQIATSLGLIALLLWWVDLSEVGGLYRSADVRLLALGLALAGADRLIMIAKWLPLVRAQGLPVRFGTAARVYLASNFASLFLPTSVGADFLRAVAIGRPFGASMEVGASIAMERVLGFVGVAVVLGVALPLALRGTPGLDAYAALAGGGMAFVLLFAALPFAPGADRWLRPLLDRLRDRPVLGHVARLAAAYSSYRSHPRLVAAVGIASAFEQLVPVALYGLVALALDIQIDFIPLLAATTLSQLLGRLPVSVSGIGVEEGAAVVFLGLFGLTPSSALSLAVGRRVLESTVFMSGALFWSDMTHGTAGTVPAEGVAAGRKVNVSGKVPLP